MLEGGRGRRGQSGNSRAQVRHWALDSNTCSRGKSASARRGRSGGHLGKGACFSLLLIGPTIVGLSKIAREGKFMNFELRFEPACNAKVNPFFKIREWEGWVEIPLLYFI